MLVIRPTASLARKMGTRLETDAEASTTVMGDWYANGLVLSRKQYILCMSEKARLPLLLAAAPYSSFHERLIPAIGDLLLAIGVPNDKVERELGEMESGCLAKTESRSLLGSMTEIAYQCEAYDRDGHFDHTDLLAMSIWAADIISLVLEAYTPKEAALHLFGLPVRLKRHAAEMLGKAGRR